MKPVIIKPAAKPRSKTRDAVARWIGFAALAALLVMATLPVTSGQRDVAAANNSTNNSTHWSETWRG